MTKPMDDLISRQAAIKALEDAGMTNYLATGDFYGIINALTVIKNMPTADLSEYSDKLWKTAYERGKAEAHPKKGKWIPVTNGRGGHECDQCHEYAPSWQTGEEHLTNYCPNCGARMEE